MRAIWNTIADYIRECDKLLFIFCIAAGGFGCIAVWSATNYIGSSRQFLTQLITLFIGIIGVVIISSIDYKHYKKLWPIIVLVALVPVILTFFIGFAPEGTDDKAWLRLPGGLTFQPAELLKIAFIITFSIHLEKVGERVNNLKHLIPLCIHGAFPVILVHLQGDDGTAMIFAAIMLLMLYSAGLKARYFIILIAAVLVAAPVIYFLVMNEDQQARLQSMFNLEDDLQGSDWQQWRGRIALASGGWFGKGLFNGPLTQTGDVPESYNDFIFVSIGEELGVIGCLVCLVLLATICFRILRIGAIAREKRGKLMCVGAFAMLFSQIIINLGMCLSVTPVIGVPLPFFSAGGTSLVCLFAAMGVIMSVYMHRNSRHMRLRD
ncbi:MAG: FtsW/RodA/SpoVE family cell cycle protein [Clostridia bacterium]|nr:FtsW/RodA/SpoVE family cell cycle protein [Clostridia bacterium]